MTASIRERIKSRSTAPKKVVDDPDLGKVELRGMSSGQLEDFYDSLRIKGGSKVDDRRFRQRYLARSIYDGGSLVYDPSKPEDIEELAALPLACVNRLFLAAQQINGEGADAEGNSQPTDGGDSASA